MRRLIPAANFSLFIAIHYLLLIGHVPAANQLPATFGAASLTAMTAAMVLAARFPFIDSYMIGPGRSYRMHRWLAYTAVITVVIHWVLARPVGDGIIPVLASPASEVGKYATIIFIALVAMSAIENIPYRIWKITHYFMVPIYLAAVFHTFFSRIPIVSGAGAWWMLVALAVLGIGSMIRIGTRHLNTSAEYVIVEASPIKHGVDLRLKPASARHEIHWKPGQFAVISIDGVGSEERHPFTICSSARSPQLRFVIGNRGHYTQMLQQRVETGARVRIHEVAGEFAPDYVPDRRQQQVWVAGGIGITPFLAAIDAMAADDGPAVDLIYCFRSLEWAFDVERLVEASHRLPQLRVHFIETDKAGHFEHKMLPRLCAPGWQDGDLYVCGPEPLIDLVCSAWRRYRARGKIHVELFDFRTGWHLPGTGKKQGGRTKAKAARPGEIVSFT